MLCESCQKAETSTDIAKKIGLYVANDGSISLLPALPPSQIEVEICPSCWRASFLVPEEWRRDYLDTKQPKDNPAEQ
jgi:hypothetical protein